jgi:hypothetical protein
MAPDNDYIAEAILPPMQVAKQSGKIFAIDTEDDIHRPKETTRAAGAEPQRVGQRASSAMTYNCEDHALVNSVTIEEVQQAVAEAQPAIDCVRNLTERLKLDQEIQVQAALDTALSDADTPATKWDDQLSNPIADIKTAILAMRGAGGVIPNAAACDYAVFLNLLQHADIQAKVTSVLAPGAYMGFEAAKQLLATVFGLTEFNVARISRKNTTAKGTNTPSLSTIWGKDLFLYFKEPSKRGTANVGVTAVWTESFSTNASSRLGGGLVDGWGVYVQDGGFRKATEYMVSRYYDAKIFNTGSGIKIPDVIT